MEKRSVSSNIGLLANKADAKGSHPGQAAAFKSGAVFVPLLWTFYSQLTGNGTGVSSIEATNTHWEREKNYPYFLNQKEFFFFFDSWSLIMKILGRIEDEPSFHS